MEQSLSRAESRARALAREAERAQLLALRSHLDPHFLFNTLNAIAEWCREDGEVAERATLELSQMLRAVLEGVRRKDWPLAKELELVDTLLDLHLIRDPELFTLERNVPDPIPDVGVPPMIFLPIVENAVKHGPAKGHRGRLSFTIHGSGETLRVVVENPGRYEGRREGGEGIAMVERRLALAYGERATLVIEGVEDRTRVTVTLLGTPEDDA
jgi:LytS/YehU family sensor histidine kinase